ncbi:DUF3443 family protein [Rhodoferax sp. GW822-FHT02A01]|uniref:DUF3443 family protein n=1 Tax=Rhodoferax sp. GW822-FHT02A01 TaxID=3141537 RepID=UPI00315D4B16
MNLLPFLGHLRSLVFCSALCLAMLTGCGGGGSGNSASTSAASLPPSAASASDSNVAIVSVEAGPGSNVNIPYVTVTLCVPGTTTCKSIDHVLLDTGSTGLRIFSSNLSAAPALSLPAQTINGSSTITECAQFLNSVAWGSIKNADVRIGNKTASSMAVQVMDSNMPAGLSSVCSSNPVMVPPGTATGNQTALSANGILGVSLFANDGQHYFYCASPTTACYFIPATNQQVQNPVTQFASDNNGVVVQLPTISSTGNTSAQGYLIFGVGTQSNNSLGSANVVAVNANSGYFTTNYKGSNFTHSFIDSGSNGLYFDDASISTSCTYAATGFYCPPSSLSLSATLGSASVNFSIANADSLFTSGASNYAFNNLGGTLATGYFDWGLPFFFGRYVYTVVEGKTVGAQTGPFYAFTN